MPSYKLTYFNARGRAELARFVFAQAGIEYEDVRLTGEEFGKIKPNLPTGMLPILEVDGTTLTGSVPFAWYLAREYDLAGSNNLEQAKIGGIIDVVGDFHGKMAAAHFGNDEAVKEKAMKALKEEHTPKYCGILEKIISANNSPDGWALGNTVTLADLAICVLLDAVFTRVPALADSFPNVKKNVDAVKALPNIAKWLKKRPETQF